MKKGMFILTMAMLAAGLLATQATGKDVQLGVYLQDLSDSSREIYEFDGDGVLVTGVVQSSGAHRAGLSHGDIIMAFNGVHVADADALAKVINQTDAGDEVKVTVYRDNKVKSLAVVMGKAGQSNRWESKAPDSQANEFWKDHTGKYWESQDRYQKQAEEYRDYADQWKKWMYVTGDNHPWMGVGYLDLTDQLADFFHVKHGVLISEVLVDSPAEEAGLKAGDVLAVWAGEPLNSTVQFLDLLRKGEEGDEVELVIVRKGEKRKAEITLGERKAEGLDQYRNFFDNKNTPGPGYRSYSYQWPGRVVVPPSTPGPAAPPRMAAPDMPPIPEMPAITDSVQELQKTLGEQQKQLKKLMKEIQALKKQQQQKKR